MLFVKMLLLQGKAQRSRDPGAYVDDRLMRYISVPTQILGKSMKMMIEIGKLLVFILGVWFECVFECWSSLPLVMHEYW